MAGQIGYLLWSISPRWLFPKTSKVSISMSSHYRHGNTIRFFFHLNNQTFFSRFNSIETWDEGTRFYFLRYIAVICHKLSHFNSEELTFDFTWNYCRLLEAKKFSINPGQFKWGTRETRYHMSIAEHLK